MKNKDLCWSKYNTIIANDNGTYLLYNSYSNVFLELDKDAYKDIQAIKSQIKNKQYNSSQELHEILYSNSIISNENSYDTIQKMKTSRLFQQADTDLKLLTILPTLDCNFNCSYCYESSRPSKYLDKNTEELIINNIVCDKSFNNLHINWFGGEPLLGFESIKRISNKLISEDICLDSSIITNGYLLTEDVADQLLKLKINTVQVTIDGIGECHNLRRPHKTMSDSFEVIINNLEYLYKHYNDNISVSIRINVDKTNKETYIDSYTFLKKKFPKYHIYPGIVRENNICQSTDNCLFSNADLFEFIKLNREEHNLSVMPIFPKNKMNICTAEKLNSYVIGPDGEIYKCYNDVGLDSKIVSHIDKSKNLTNSLILSRYISDCNPLETTNCKECTILPICNGGGCVNKRLEAKYSEGNSDYCTYFKDNLKSLLTMHYEEKRNAEELKEV